MFMLYLPYMNKREPVLIQWVFSWNGRSICTITKKQARGKHGKKKQDRYVNSKNWNINWIMLEFADADHLSNFAPSKFNN